MADIEHVSELIKELQRLMDLHGDVKVESFFEGCNGGMNIHYEPEHPATKRGYDVYGEWNWEKEAEPATIYIGEEWYA